MFYFVKIIILAIFLASVFWSGLALAQVSITVYPTSFRLSLNPGDFWESEVTVVNPNNFPLLVRPEKENFGTGDEGSIKLLGVENGEYGLISWIKIDQTDIVLAPKDRHTWKFSIKVPLQAQPGGHYAAVLFRGLEAEQQTMAGSGIGISGRVGALVLVEVSGDLKQGGAIEDLVAPKFISHGPLPVSFKINNTGNSHFNPGGKVIFTGWFQNNEADIEPKTIFGGYSRSFEARWEKRYLFGPISVRVLAKIPNGPELAAKSITIWAFPWQEFSALLIVLFFSLFGTKWLKRKFKIIRR